MKLPRIERMGMARYLKSQGIAHHELELMGKTPAHYKAYIDGKLRPKTKEQLRNEALGVLTHTAVLEPKLFKRSYYVRPETYPDAKTGLHKPWNNNATVCEEWNQEHSNRLIITGKESWDILGMRGSVHSKASMRHILSQGSAELTFTAHDPESGFILKARPDWHSGAVFVNLKTARSASKRAFSYSIDEYNYDSGAAYHIHVAKLCGVEITDYVFFAVEKEPPYASATYRLSPRSLELGAKKFQRWLKTLRLCLDSNEWPDYNDGIEEIDVPDRAFYRPENLVE